MRETLAPDSGRQTPTSQPGSPTRSAIARRTVRTVDTYTDADSHVVSDPRQAVRLDRDVYDDAGHLVRREWWYVADGGD